MKEENFWRKPRRQAKMLKFQFFVLDSLKLRMENNVLTGKRLLIQLIHILFFRDVLGWHISSACWEPSVNIHNKLLFTVNWYFFQFAAQKHAPNQAYLASFISVRRTSISISSGGNLMVCFCSHVPVSLRKSEQNIGNRNYSHIMRCKLNLFL